MVIGYKNITDISFSPVDKIVKEQKLFPVSFNIIQNYPNPFNTSTTIKHLIPKVANVKISINNILGGGVKVIFNSFRMLVIVIEPVDMLSMEAEMKYLTGFISMN